MLRFQNRTRLLSPWGSDLWLTGGAIFFFSFWSQNFKDWLRRFSIFLAFFFFSCSWLWLEYWISGVLKVCLVLFSMAYFQSWYFLSWNQLKWFSSFIFSLWTILLKYLGSGEITSRFTFTLTDPVTLIKGCNAKILFRSLFGKYTSDSDFPITVACLPPSFLLSFLPSLTHLFNLTSITHLLIFTGPSDGNFADTRGQNWSCVPSWCLIMSCVEATKQVN